MAKQQRRLKSHELHNKIYQLLNQMLKSDNNKKKLIKIS